MPRGGGGTIVTSSSAFDWQVFNAGGPYIAQYSVLVDTALVANSLADAKVGDSCWCPECCDLGDSVMENEMN